MTLLWVTGCIFGGPEAAPIHASQANPNHFPADSSTVAYWDEGSHHTYDGGSGADDRVRTIVSYSTTPFLNHGSQCEAPNIYVGRVCPRIQLECLHVSRATNKLSLFNP